MRSRRNAGRGGRAASPTPLFQEANNKIVKTELTELHSCSLFQVGAEPRVATTGKWDAPRTRMRERDTSDAETCARVTILALNFEAPIDSAFARSVCLNDVY